MLPSNPPMMASLTTVERFGLHQAEETARRLEAEAEDLRWAALSPRERAAESRLKARQARARVQARRSSLTTGTVEQQGTAAEPHTLSPAAANQRRAAIFDLANVALAGEVRLDVKTAFESPKTIAQIAEDVQQMVFERRISTLMKLRTFAESHGVQVDMSLAGNRTMSLDAIREHVCDAMAAASESIAINSASPHPTARQASDAHDWDRALKRTLSSLSFR